MATRRDMRTSRTHGETITIANLTNSLYHIEQWCHAVREALCCLHPDTCIPCPTEDLEVLYSRDNGGLKVEGGCPPPKGEECHPPGHSKPETGAAGSPRAGITRPAKK